MSLDKSSEKKQRKLTPKQEKFCQNIVSGMNPSEAYRKAYNPKNSSKKTIAENASHLLKSTNILPIIEEKKAQIEEQLNYTAQDSFNKFNELQKKALENQDLSVAAKIEELKGKLAGLYTEKKDINVGVKAIQVIFDQNCKDL